MVIRAGPSSRAV